MNEILDINLAEAIPFNNFNEKINIVLQELSKDRYVEVWDGFVYSAKKWDQLGGD